jgi:hypothetical protein
MFSDHKGKMNELAVPGIFNYNNGKIISIPSSDIRIFQVMATMHNRNLLLLLRYMRSGL